MAYYVINANNKQIVGSVESTVCEPLFLNPDGVRKRFPIGWSGVGRYTAGTLAIYRKGVRLVAGTDYTEEDNGIFFNFAAAPTTTYAYDDYSVTFVPRSADLSFSKGHNAYLFPNWRGGSNIDAGFWIGKNLACHADATASTAGSAAYPASIAGAVPWVSISCANAATVCAKDGCKGHLTQNREYANIIHWCAHHGIYPLGCTVAGSSSAVGQDGMGVEGTQDPINLGGTLTGTGCLTWSHNMWAGGIQDLVGNRWEWVSGIEMRIISSVNTLYIANNTGTLVDSGYTMSFTDTSGTALTYIQNNTTMYEEIVPSSSAGVAVLGKDGCYYGSTNSTVYSCRRFGGYSRGALAGLYCTGFDQISTYTSVDTGFRISWTLAQAEAFM